MKEWIVKIIAFAVLSSIANMLLSKSSVSKYARLCISLSLTFIIISPVVRFVGSGDAVALPVIAPKELSENNPLIDSEVSKRLTERVRIDIRDNNITISAKVGYREILSVHITGDNKEQHQELEKLLLEKYGIASEKIKYGTD